MDEYRETARESMEWLKTGIGEMAATVEDASCFVIIDPGAGRDFLGRLCPELAAVRDAFDIWMEAAKAACGQLPTAKAGGLVPDLRR